MDFLYQRSHLDLAGDNLLTTGIYATTAFRQSLKLADNLMPQVRARTKSVTVRTGRRDIAIGGLMFESTRETQGRCIVIVTQVVVCALKDAPSWALAGEGLKNKEELLKVLLDYYPSISMDSEITAIEFAYAGEAVDADARDIAKAA